MLGQIVFKLDYFLFIDIWKWVEQCEWTRLFDCVVYTSWLVDTTSSVTSLEHYGPMCET